MSVEKKKQTNPKPLASSALLWYVLCVPNSYGLNKWGFPPLGQWLIPLQLLDWPFCTGASTAGWAWWCLVWYTCSGSCCAFYSYCPVLLAGKEAWGETEGAPPRRRSWWRQGSWGKIAFISLQSVLPSLAPYLPSQLSQPPAGARSLTAPSLCFWAVDSNFHGTGSFLGNISYMQSE